MKHIVRHLLAFIVFFMLFTITGCSEKPSETESSLPVENTTELVLTNAQDPLPDTITSKSVSTPAIPQEEKKKPLPTTEPELSEAYTLRGIDKEIHKLSLDENKILLHTSNKPLTLIHLFDTDSDGAISQVPYLSKLQKNHLKQLTVIAIPTNDTLTQEDLTSWVKRHQAEYFISVNDESTALAGQLSKELNITVSPTTLLYHNGESYNHYEGATPIEMITHDILQTTK